MNFDPVALNTFPSFLTHSPSNGGEGFSPPNKQLRLDTERERKELIFADAPPARIAHRPRDIQLPKFGVKEGISSCFRFLGSLRGRGE